MLSFIYLYMTCVYESTFHPSHPVRIYVTDVGTE